MRLERCCFCSSLRFGCVVFGLIFVILQVVAIVKYGTTLDDLRVRNIGDSEVQKKAFIRHVVFLVLTFVILVFGVTTLFATIMRFASFLKANAGMILVVTFLYCAVSILKEPTYSDREPVFGVYFLNWYYTQLIVEVVFYVYFSVVLWSYADELEDQSLKGYASSRISY